LQRANQQTSPASADALPPLLSSYEQHPTLPGKALCSNSNPHSHLMNALMKCCSVPHPAQHKSSARQQSPSWQHAGILLVRAGGCLLSVALGDMMQLLLQVLQELLHALFSASAMAAGLAILMQGLSY
jgi:hypothetical protein